MYRFDYIFGGRGGCRFLAKILAPEGSKDVAVGQPVAVTVSFYDAEFFFDLLLSNITYNVHFSPTDVSSEELEFS